MKRPLLTLLIPFFVLSSAFAAIEHLMPKPQMVEAEGKSVSLSKKWRVQDPTHNSALQRWMDEVGVKVTDNPQAPLLQVSLVSQIPSAQEPELAGTEPEAYRLTISQQSILVEAFSPTGVTRAMQTLTQLCEGWKGHRQLELCTITDWPAFRVRGLMLDIGRDYMEVDDLMHVIDLLSRFKVNVLHWHLTDHQGFRFESRRYPQLQSDVAYGRHTGKYYTQEQCTQVEQYAHERGMTIIPEIDMPGHSSAFTRAMGHEMATPEGREECLALLDELCQAFPLAPYIHIGADETNSVTTEFLRAMTDRIHQHGRRSVVWNRLGNNAAPDPQAQGIDMTQMWATRGRAVAGVPNIDCRYNYINHFDTFADPIGIYRSNVYYQTHGTPEVAGAITAIWTDRRVEDTRNLIAQNGLYVNALATAERCWMGGGKQYIEQGGVLIPTSGEERQEVIDWERRFLFHKAHSLRHEPIPYVAQTQQWWRVTDPMPNGGDATRVFSPEIVGPRQSYIEDGVQYDTHVVSGATVYLRHTWGGVVPGLYGDARTNQTAYAWTRIYSPRRQRLGALIEFQNYGRSEVDLAPQQGCWDWKGSRIWVNDKEMLPPTWDNSGVKPSHEVPIRNENLSARPAIPVTLNKGWNTVMIKLPYIDLPRDVVRLNKWMFSFALEGGEGLVYATE